MKKLIGFLICAVSFAIATPTDYINGKWRTCETVKYNAHGDTVYHSTMSGSKTWYTYIKPHKVANYRMDDGTRCKLLYSVNGQVRGETCSDGSWYKSTYDKNGNLIKQWDWRTTNTYSYDNHGNMIYAKSVASEDWDELAGTSESWYEYDGDTLLSETLSIRDKKGSLDQKILFYSNGNKKYEKAWSATYKHEHWYDEHGYITHIKQSDYGKSFYYEKYYTNKYDDEGRIVYEGGTYPEGASYQYFELNDIHYKCLLD